MTYNHSATTNDEDQTQDVASPSAKTPEQQLAAGIEQLGLHVPPEARARLLAYVTLLAKWNRVYNLTAVRKPAEMIARHILDSLAVAPFVRGTQVLDVGTGAGLPGIPLAVVMPDRHFVLLDSSAKKIRFVTQAIAELGLANVQAVQSRAQDFRPVRLFDTVVSRAFASIASMVEAAAHLCSEEGRLLAMKGAYPQEELEAVPAGFRITGVQALRVPGLEDAQRHVVCIERKP